MPKLITDKEEVGLSSELEPDEFFLTKKFERVLLIDTSDTLDSTTEEDIYNVTGMPAIGTLLRGAYLKKIILKEREVSLWEARLQYDSKWETDTDIDLPPESRPPKFRRYTETIDEVTHIDPATQKPIVNAVGEPQPITMPKAIIVLEIERLEISPPPTVFLDYPNKTNSKVFGGAPVGSVFCGGINDEPENHNGVEYRRMTYVFKFKPEFDDQGNLKQDTWDIELIQQGTKYKVVAGQNATLDFTNRNGTPTTGNLNADGTKRDPAQDPLTFTVGRQKIDFEQLNF